MKNTNSGRLEWAHYRYSTGFPLLRLEKRMFGWHYEGKTKHKVDEGYEGYIDSSNTVRIEHKFSIVKYAHFSRPTIFASNIVFQITELLSKLVSFFRRLSLKLIIVAFIAGGLSIEMKEYYGLVSTILYIVYFGLPALSLALALLGLLWRKVFHLDEKCDERMRQEGFVVWSETKEGNNMDD